MPMDWPIREQSLFLAFWGAMILLGAIEFLVPQFPGNADRRRRWPTNFGLGIINGLIASLVPALTVASAWWAARADIGLLNWLAAPGWVALIATLVVKSLGQYSFHLLSHEVGFLWRLHRVHHRDVHLDISSALRTHPLEMIASILFMIPLIVICGLSPIVLAAYETAELFANILSHTNVRIPDRVERLARTLLLTPSLHRLHHSAARIETDSNYGNLFTIWGRLFGTYRGEAVEPGSFRFGLDDVSRERAGDFRSQLGLPWR
jgi:sterol desaturase/sphingolipid hydroxylase (fatty acid hydroxylase superfamily)